MKLLVAMVILALAECSIAQVPLQNKADAEVAQATEVYSMLLKEDGHTWCAYKDNSYFQSAVKKNNPTESARVVFTSKRPVDLTYQIEAESGDWVVVDKYTKKNKGVILRRANLLTQDNLQVIQEAFISDGKSSPFRVISVSTLDGKKAKLSPDVDLPQVSVSTSLGTNPAVRVAADLQSREGAGELCESSHL